jgi:hypothetical protein
MHLLLQRMQGAVLPRHQLKRRGETTSYIMPVDDQDSSLESTLRSLPLREPSLRLDARIDATLKEFRARRSRRLRLYPFAIAASLLIAIGIGFKMTRPKTPPITAEVATAATPIQIERDTSTVYDDGVIASTDDAAYQQYRRRTVREIWYVDPKTHAQSRVVIPTEQVFIQKVDAY